MSNFSLKFVSKIAALAFVGFSIAPSAQAATCSAGGVDYTVSQDGIELTATYCETGNDKNFTAITDNWILGDDATSADGDDTLTLSVLSGPPNTWAISNPSGYNSIAIAFKQASSFAFFVLDTAELLQGTWTISGPGGSQDDYSHVDAWYQTGGGVKLDPIPLPAGFPLMMAGLGAFGALRLRSKKRKTA